MSYRSQFVAELSVSLISLGIPLFPVAGAGDWNSRHSGGGQGGVWVVRLGCCWCKASLKEESSIVSLSVLVSYVHRWCHTHFLV